MSAVCERATLVEAMFDGRLGASERASTERHLKSCGTCAELLRELTLVAQLLRSSAGDVPPLEHQRARLALLRKSAQPLAKKRRPAVWLVAALVTLPVAVWAATSSLSPLRFRETLFMPAHVPLTSASGRKHTPIVLTSLASPMAAPLPPAPAAVPASSTATLLASPAATADAAMPTNTPAHARATPETVALVPQNSPASQTFAAAMQSLSRGDFSASAGKLKGFASAYPRDPRVEDATYLEAIALERAGRISDAKAAAQRYLGAYPNGSHQAQARRIAGD
jgi:TolA-binding protein